MAGTIPHVAQHLSGGGVRFLAMVLMGFMNARQRHQSPPILKIDFSEQSIHALALFLAAAGPTVVAMACLELL